MQQPCAPSHKHSLGTHAGQRRADSGGERPGRGKPALEPVADQMEPPAPRSSSSLPRDVTAGPSPPSWGFTP